MSLARLTGKLVLVALSNPLPRPGLALALVVACSDHTRLLAVPEGIDQFVVLELRADLSFVRGSLLQEGSSLMFDAAEDRAYWILGWPSALVPASSTREGEAILAESCDVAMPAPAWTVDAGTGEPLPAASLPRITFPWLNAACPKDEPAPVLTTPCADAACAPTVSKARCSFELTVTDCTTFFAFRGPKVLARGRPDGTYCITSEGCVTAADGSMSCQSAQELTCGISARAPRAPLEARVTKRKWADLPGRVPDGFEAGTRNLGARTLAAGYATDLLPLESSVVIATHAGRYEEQPCGDGPDELLFLDAQTLETVRTATAAPCTRNFVAASAGGGFYSLEGGGESLAVVHFDSAGRPTAKINLWEGDEELSGLELTRDSRGQLVAALMPRLGRLGTAGGSVFLVEVAPDLSSKRPRVQVPGDRREIWVLSEPGEVIAAPDDFKNDVLFFDGTSNLGALHVGPSAGVTNLLRPIALGDGRFLMSIVGTYPRLVVTRADLTGLEPASILFDESMAPTAVARRSDGTVLVALYPTIRELTGSKLATFNPDAGDYSSGPGALTDGPIGRIRVAEDGTVFMLAPWTGEVVRLP
ncbi:MAG: hypothetical protein HYV07_24055 [Deltaproteobacteria bacterium]|nr:hypothetical protein [Deltaproteobacteria bacterium]